MVCDKTMRKITTKCGAVAMIWGICIISLFYMAVSSRLHKNDVAVTVTSREVLTDNLGSLSKQQENIKIKEVPNSPNLDTHLINGGEQVHVRHELTKLRPKPNLNEYWSKILHFVPEENNQNCLNLFTTNTSKDITITNGFERAISKINNELSRIKLLKGRAPQHKKLTLTYQALARHDFVHTVCEIGFNAGQSSVAWLTAKPGIMLYSFDIGAFPWTKPLGKFVKKMFPDQFNLTIGDSTKTIPIWTELGKKCDIVSVDGGHLYPVVSKDFINVKAIVAKEHILIADDIYFPGVNKAWKEMASKGDIENHFDCWIHGLDIDFVIGHYNK